MFYNEIKKLADGLDEMEIEFKLVPLLGGWQILVFDENGDVSWDAICHKFSYGHEKGLLEIMGSIVDNPYDVVEGGLTAAEVLERL